VLPPGEYDNRYRLWPLFIHESSLLLLLLEHCERSPTCRRHVVTVEKAKCHEVFVEVPAMTWILESIIVDVRSLLLENTRSRWLPRHQRNHHHHHVSSVTDFIVGLQKMTAAKSRRQNSIVHQSTYWQNIRYTIYVLFFSFFYFLLFRATLYYRQKLRLWALSLTLWRPLLPYGYSYKASCARPG